MTTARAVNQEQGIPVAQEQSVRLTAQLDDFLGGMLGTVYPVQQVLLRTIAVLAEFFPD